MFTFIKDAIISVELYISSNSSIKKIESIHKPIWIFIKKKKIIKEWTKTECKEQSRKKLLWQTLPKKMTEEDFSLTGQVTTGNFVAHVKWKQTK